MNDIEMLRELARETPLAGLAELGPARTRLVAAIAADPAAGCSAQAAQPPGRKRYPRRRLALTGVVAAGVSAVIAAVVATAVCGWASNLSGPAAGSTGRLDPAAARVLHRAALAALQLRAGAPRPSQFIYTKIANGDGSLYQSWLSVDGTRTGLVRGAGGGPASIYIPGCRDGHQVRVNASRAAGGTPGGRPCVPQPAYHPQMPTSLPALRSYLDQDMGVNPDSSGYLNDFGKTVDELLTQAYLTSGQRAALYDLMAQTPGFTLIPHATDGIGRRGVGIAWSPPGGGGRNVIIFDPHTYAELGIMTWGTGGQKGSGALLKIAIVNTAGQLP